MSSAKPVSSKLGAIQLGDLGMPGVGGGSFSWQLGDMLIAMSNMLTGVFVAHPLAIPSAPFGNFALPAKMLTGTASYLSKCDAAVGAAQIIELRTSGPTGDAALGLTVRRIQ